MATSYPSSLASQPLDQSEQLGAITPSHGGMVQGHEYDIPISQNTHTTLSSANTPALQTTTTTIITTDDIHHPHQSPGELNHQSPRTPVREQPLPPLADIPSIPSPIPSAPSRTTSTHRQRPASMPPQQYTPSNTTDRDRQHQDDAGRPSRAEGSKSRSTNRILGDYTLSKTLGAGSMGKVKLAHHNLTGEKVRSLPFFLPQARFHRCSDSLSLAPSPGVARCQDSSSCFT